MAKEVEQQELIPIITTCNLIYSNNFWKVKVSNEVPASE